MAEFGNTFEAHEQGMHALAAEVTYHLYTSFVEAGFDEDQAMALLITIIQGTSGGEQ